MRIPESTAPRDALPAGDYRARLVNAEDTVSKSGNPMVRCTYQVTSPKDHRGSELRDYVVFTEKAFWRVEIVAKALQVTLNAGEDVEPDQFAEMLFDSSRKGVEVVLRVEHETSEEFGTQARIRKVLKLTDAQQKDADADPDIPFDAPQPQPEAAAATDDDSIPF